MTEFFQFLLSGLSNGCVYALVALGFVIIANVTRVYNFAQGTYVMVGGMVVVAAHKGGFPTALAVLVGVAAVALVALVQERTTVAPLRGKASPLVLVVLSLGFATLLQGAALLIWGKDPLSLPSFSPGTFKLFGASLDNQTIFIWSATALALVGVVGLFRYTAVGQAMRACAANPTAARLLGIRTERMSMAAFVLAGALTGLVGTMIVPLASVTWNSGTTVGLVAFIAAALAGFERPVRAVVAGLALGCVETLASGYISSSYNAVIVYGVLLVYLLGRDLFGDEGLVRRIVLARRAGRRRGVQAPRLAGMLPTIPDSLAALRSPERPGWAVLAPLVGIGVLALAPVVLSTGGQAMSSATFIVLSAIGATGLVMVMGLAGQFSLGQAGFYLLSGYTAAILTTKHGWSPLPTMAVATTISLLAGLIIGWLCLRLKGFNLAIATLAIDFILLVVVQQDTSLTGGPQGLIGLPKLTLLGVDFSGQKAFFWLALGVLIVCLVVSRNLTRSRVGRALRAIGADEEGARSIGVDAFRLKLLVFVLAAGMAGLAGSLWAFYLQFAAPANWGFDLTISLVTYVVVGGITSVYGGLVGALVVGALQYWIRFQATSGLGSASSDYEVVMNGAFLIVFLLLFRNGLAVFFSVDNLRQLWRRVRGGQPPGALATGGTPAEVSEPLAAGTPTQGAAAMTGEVRPGV